MKLNAAAVLAVSLVSFFFILSSTAAFALDGIDLSHPSEAVEDGGCSQLVQIKYPFLSCANGEIGLADDNATWENSRQIPIMRDWTEGDGYWGPELNGWTD